MDTIRAELKGLSVVRKQSYTIREAVDWYKALYRQRVEMGNVLLETEAEYINDKFVELIRRTNRKDELPIAAVASLVASVATAELAEELLHEQN